MKRLIEALEMDDVHIRHAVVAAAVAPGAESAAIDRLAREIRQRWPIE